MSHPLVTIAIPTYNRLEYLKEAVASASCQTFRNLEILVGDDGPTSTIPSWIREAQVREPRLRYQKNEKNVGLSANWNYVTRAARGEFIIIIGDDDRLRPTFVEKLVPLLTPEIDVAFSNHDLIDPAGRVLVEDSKAHNLLFGRGQLAPGLLKNPELAVWNNSIPMSASLIRRSRILQFPFSEELNTPEIETFLKIARCGGCFTFLPEILAEYRVHPQSATGAGLWVDRLAARLVPLDVAPEVEPAKRRLLEPIVAAAVSRCLKEGRRQEAQRWLHSPYYPMAGSRGALGGIHRLCAILPARIGTPLFRFLLKLRQSV